MKISCLDAKKVIEGAMTEEEVRRYMELVDRKSFILLHSGASWKPEYAAELKDVDRELTGLRGIIDRMHEQREKEITIVRGLGENKSRLSN